MFRVGAVESGSMDITCAATSQVRGQVERFYCIIFVLHLCLFIFGTNLIKKNRQGPGRSGDLVSTEYR